MNKELLYQRASEKNISIIEIYTNKDSERVKDIKIRVKCNICCKEFITTWRSLLRLDSNTVCKNCKLNNRRITEYNKLKCKLEKINFELITTKEEYSGFDSLIIIKCKNCGKIQKYTRKSTKRIKCGCYDKIKRFNNTFNDFKLLEYREKGKSKFLSVKCGHEFELSFNRFMNSKKCPICASNSRKIKSFKNLQKKMKERCPEFELLEYNGWKKNALVRHSCGLEFEIIPENLLIRNRCPKCDKKLSIGCKEIRKFLIENSIPYKVEYSFKDLKDRYVLRFDFAIFDNSDNLKFLIEYDGIQHFSTEKGYFGDSLEIQLEDLLYIQNHDKMKDEYCRMNNITLHRIKYDDDIKQKIKLIFNDYPNGGEIPQ